MSCGSGSALLLAHSLDAEQIVEFEERRPQRLDFQFPEGGHCLGRVAERRALSWHDPEQLGRHAVRRQDVRLRRALDPQEFVLRTDFRDWRDLDAMFVTCVLRTASST